MGYVSLHTHSEFSLLDSVSRPDAMMRRLATIGQTAMGITDHGVMAAIPELLKSGAKHGVKLLAGCEFYVSAQGLSNRESRDTYHLTVLALDKEGYHNLCKLHSIAFIQGYYYDPRIDLDVLNDHSAGLVALSGCLGGALPKALLKDEGGEQTALDRANDLVQIFGKERFFIELQNHGIAEQIQIEPWLRSTAKKLGLKTCATNDSHYSEKKDWIPHDIHICLGTGKKRDDPNRYVVYEPEEFYLKTEDDMLERFDKASVLQSGKITDMADPLDLTTKQYHIPKFSEARSVSMSGVSR